VHADRGGQCWSRGHRTLLDLNGLISSICAKVNWGGNSAMGSWNHRFEIEAIHGGRFATRAQA
jgi:hypothetical protein